MRNDRDGRAVTMARERDMWHVTAAAVPPQPRIRSGECKRSASESLPDQLCLKLPYYSPCHGPMHRILALFLQHMCKIMLEGATDSATPDILLSLFSYTCKCDGLNIAERV